MTDLSRDELKRDFADNLRRARKRADLSQEKLWFASGIHATEISRLERGLQDPRLSTVVRLSRGLGITPSKLLRGVR